MEEPEQKYKTGIENLARSRNKEILTKSKTRKST